MRVKLSQWAKQQGIAYITAFRWFHKGEIKNQIQTPSGSIFVEVDDEKKEEKIQIYCRVSNRERKDEMEYQVNRLKLFQETNGFKTSKVYKEIASGMNEQRKEMWNMINWKPDVLIIEHKDRLQRFGYSYIKKIIESHGGRIIIVNPEETKEQDLMKDFAQVIYSFCARMYGMRKAYNKAKEIKKHI